MCTSGSSLFGINPIPLSPYLAINNLLNCSNFFFPNVQSLYFISILFESCKSIHYHFFALLIFCLFFRTVTIFQSLSGK